MVLRWTQEQADAHQAKVKNSRSRSRANVEQHTEHVTEEPNQVKNTVSPVVIRFTHYRRRLADIDNFATKHFVDSLVKNGLLRDDSAEEVAEVRHRQVKIEMWEEERFEIEFLQGEENG